MAEQVNYGISGAMTGAQAGAAFGPVGAIAGAVIGGVAGAFAGSSARRARVLANRANKTQRMMQLLEAGIQRRDMIRQARISRAETLAAGASMGRGDTGSSAISGALSSTGSQLAFNTRYFDARIQDYLLMQRWIDKAGKAAKNAEQGMALINLAGSAVSLYGGMKAPSGGYTAPSLSGTQNTTWGGTTVEGGSWGMNYNGPNANFPSTGWGINRRP